MSNSINFLPEDYLENKARQRVNLIGLVMFIVVVAGVGGAIALTHQRQMRMTDRIEQVNNELATAGGALKQLEEMDNKRNQMLEKAKISAMLMEPLPRSLILATITNNLPPDCALTDFGLTCKEPKQTATAGTKAAATTAKSTDAAKPVRRSSTAGKSKTAVEKESEPAVKELETQIQITGVALDDLKVAMLIDNLNQASLFKSVDLVYSEEFETKGKTSMKKFVIKMVIAPSTKATPEAVEWARRQHVQGM